MPNIFQNTQYFSEIISKKLDQLVCVDRIEVRGKTQNTFCSTIYYITIEYYVRDQSNIRTEVRLIAKVPSTDRPYFGILTEVGLYANEKSVYETVLPYMYEALNWKTVDGLVDSLAPKYYGSAGDHTLLLEDLIANGFALYPDNEKLLLDREHSVLVFKTLAKFHLSSYKFRLEHPTLATNKYKLVHCESMVKYCLKNRTSDILLGLMRHENSDVDEINQISSIFQRMPLELSAEVDENRFRIVVLNHGDSKIDNYLFKYETNDEGVKIPVQIKLIDFQMARWSSPALDILTLSIMCMGREVYESHFDQFLDIYISAFNDSARKLSVPVTYTKDDLIGDMKKLIFCKYYALMSSASILVGPDLIASHLRGDATIEQIVSSICDNKNIKKTLLDLVDRVRLDKKDNLFKK